MCSMTQACLHGVWGRSKVYVFTLRTNICSETLSKKNSIFILMLLLPYIDSYTVPITEQTYLLFAPFPFTGVCCIGWVFFHMFCDSDTNGDIKECPWSRWKWSLWWAFLIQGLNFALILSSREFVSLTQGLFTLLDWAPPFKGAKFWRLVLTEPWMCFLVFPVSFSQDLLNCQ